MTNIKILFLWEIAGVSYNIANYIRKNNLGEAKILHRDIYNNFAFKKSCDDLISIKGTRRDFYKKCYNFIKEFKPNLIHINDFEKGVLVSKLASPRTPIIFQYHGTKLRNKMKIPLYVRKMTKKIVVSTFDIIVPGTSLLGVPIPEFDFNYTKVPGSALFVRSKPEDKTYQAKKFCEENNLNLIIFNRLGDKDITILEHKEFLDVLASFEYYLDLKGLTNEKVLSKSGLEAIKLGCKVLTDGNKILTKFDMFNEEDYLNIYKELI